MIIYSYSYSYSYSYIDIDILISYFFCSIQSDYQSISAQVYYGSLRTAHDPDDPLYRCLNEFRSSERYSLYPYNYNDI